MSCTKKKLAEFLQKNFPKGIPSGKKEAVKLVTEGGQKSAEVSRNLDIHPNVLRRWVHQFKVNGQVAFPGKGNLLHKDEEVRRLKRELASVKEERDILKKALAIFSRHSK